MKNKKFRINDTIHLEISVIPKEVRCTVFHGHTKYAVESVNPNHIAAYDNINEFLHQHCDTHKVRELEEYIETKVSLKRRL
jgi:hypothetical protein